VKVAAVQHDIVWQDPPANFARLAPMVADAAGAGARLVLLTEMFSFGFGMETADAAEAPDGPSAHFLREQAHSHECWVGASLPVLDEHAHRDHKPRNRFVLAAPDGTTHHYDKIHPFSYAHEHEYFGSGTETVVIDVDGLRVALFVCYDLRFADEFWALAPQVDAYLVPANWPAARRHHWRSLLVARAIENQAYVIGANRVGTTPAGLAYAGDSMIVDPLGESAAEVVAGTVDQESILVSDVNPSVVADVRAHYPFLADRRAPR
jgi:predicted amidohydrolase